MKREEKYWHRNKISTPIGDMVAVADSSSLQLLSFADSTSLGSEIYNLEQAVGGKISSGSSDILTLLKTELKSFFAGDLEKFMVPINLRGTDFQIQTWKALLKIPYGKTKTYKQQAQAIGKATAYRAVANANGSNKIVIVVPCHRIIASDGGLGGFSCGLERKQFLLNLEQYG